ncbi:MAG: DUF1343 domain-containing protein [Candidatus Schekmanbacteria bacterium]|nr:MAG: DUF1343 domain-containing protein [Candidatus Schekmanbacteria bacterium]
MGLQSYLKKNIKRRSRERIGILYNPASILPDYTSTLEAILKSGNGANITALFGPQHGLFSHTQDNMITWDGFIHPKLNIPVFSLYGEYRKPTEEMLSYIDTLIIDLQDIGTRVYTFASTMFYCIEECAKYGKKIIVLDRPNPINGDYVEGYRTEEDFYSFVGMLPVSMRHGLTMGEMACLYKEYKDIDCEIEIMKMKGWKRNMWFDETYLPWIMPSPNMPTLETAAVYPGIVLLEGTNISEGRGTTKPFEMIGAPYIDSEKLIKELGTYKLKGVFFRETHFQPGFNKWEKKLCNGVHIHITDRKSFKPYITGIAIIRAVSKLFSKNFKWKNPPYEYEYEKVPIDVICGTNRVRKSIENEIKLEEIEEECLEEEKKYMEMRKDFLFY